MLIKFQSPLPILFLPPYKILLIGVDSAELNSGVDDGVLVGVGSAGGIKSVYPQPKEQGRNLEYRPSVSEAVG